MMNRLKLKYKVLRRKLQELAEFPLLQSLCQQIKWCYYQPSYRSSLQYGERKGRWPWGMIVQIVRSGLVIPKIEMRSKLLSQCCRSHCPSCQTHLYLGI